MSLNRAARLGPLSSHLAAAAPLHRIVGIFTAEPRGPEDAGAARGRVAAPARVQPLDGAELPSVVKRLHVTTALLTDAAHAQAHAQLRGLPEGALVSHALRPAALILSTGRFAREFEARRRIGRGGFGVVVQARHLLDGGEYAVKRVRFRSRGEGERALLEAQAMAALSRGCAQIVRYYSSWVEAAPARGARTAEAGEEGSLGGSGSRASSGGERSRSSSLASASSGEPSGEEGEEEEEGCRAEDGRDELVDLFLHMELLDCPTLQSHNQKLGVRAQQRQQQQQRQQRQHHAAEAHDAAGRFAAAGADGAERAQGWSALEAASVVEQVATALAHAHGCGYVHRDVSPPNIFVRLGEAESGGQAGEERGECGDDCERARGRIVAKLSDFGLCTRHGQYAQHAQADGLRLTQHGAGLAGTLVGAALGIGAAEVPEARSPQTSAPEALGTYLYASPEQWRGGSRALARPSTDVYSLGVVLAEMLLAPFRTGHERASALLAFRAGGELPAAVRAERGALAQLALEMADAEPMLRPTAAEVASRARGLLALAAPSGAQRSEAPSQARPASPAAPVPHPAEGEALAALRKELAGTEALVRELAEAVRELGGLSLGAKAARDRHCAGYSAETL